MNITDDMQVMIVSNRKTRRMHIDRLVGRVISVRPRTRTCQVRLADTNWWLKYDDVVATREKK